MPTLRAARCSKTVALRQPHRLSPEARIHDPRLCLGAEWPGDPHDAWPFGWSLPSCGQTSKQRAGRSSRVVFGSCTAPGEVQPRAAIRGLCVGGVPLAKPEVVHDLVFGRGQFSLCTVFDREHIPPGASRHTALRGINKTVVDMAAPAKRPTVGPPGFIVYLRGHDTAVVTQRYCAQLWRRMASMRSTPRREGHQAAAGWLAPI